MDAFQSGMTLLRRAYGDEAVIEAFARAARALADNENANDPHLYFDPAVDRRGFRARYWQAGHEMLDDRPWQPRDWVSPEDCLPLRARCVEHTPDDCIQADKRAQVYRMEDELMRNMACASALIADAREQSIALQHQLCDLRTALHHQIDSKIDSLLGECLHTEAEYVRLVELDLAEAEAALERIQALSGELQDEGRVDAAIIDADTSLSKTRVLGAGKGFQLTFDVDSIQASIAGLKLNGSAFSRAAVGFAKSPSLSSKGSIDVHFKTLDGSAMLHNQWEALLSEVELCVSVCNDSESRVFACRILPHAFQGRSSSMTCEVVLPSVAQLSPQAVVTLRDATMRGWVVPHSYKHLPMSFRCGTYPHRMPFVRAEQHASPSFDASGRLVCAADSQDRHVSLLPIYECDQRDVPICESHVDSKLNRFQCLSKIAIPESVQSITATVVDVSRGCIIVADWAGRGRPSSIAAIDLFTGHVRWSIGPGSSHALKGCLGLALLPDMGVVVATSFGGNSIHAFRIADGTPALDVPISLQRPTYLAVFGNMLFVSSSSQKTCSSSVHMLAAQCMPVDTKNHSIPGEMSVQVHVNAPILVLKDMGCVEAAGMTDDWRPVAVLGNPTTPALGVATALLLVGTLGSCLLRVLSLPSLDLLSKVSVRIEDTPQPKVHHIACRCGGTCLKTPDPSSEMLLAGVEGMAGDPSGVCLAINAGSRITVWTWPLRPLASAKALRHRSQEAPVQGYAWSPTTYSLNNGLELEAIWRQLIGSCAADGMTVLVELSSPQAHTLFDGDVSYAHQQFMLEDTSGP